MKLKEAQMLGVLALIAVGIILLCMWGGEGGSTNAPATDQQAQASDQAPLEPDLAELYNDLLGNHSAPAAGAQGQDASASMSIGGQSPAPAAVASTGSEESALRGIIESANARDLSLQKPAPEAAAPAVVAAQAPAPAATVVHIVKAGETLSSISQKYYGTSSNWKAILDANTSVVKDPQGRDLKPNMRLIIPAADKKVASAPAASSGQGTLLSATTSSSARTYTVVKGDTLFRIAMKYYGNGDRYRDILTANRSVVSKPQDLRPGMKLVIP